MKQKISRTDLLSVLCLLLCIAFYTVFVLVDGPVLCVDSDSYMRADTSRPPLYPLVLMIFRQIFGESASAYGSPLYLFPAALFAAVINGYAAWRIGHAMWREMKKRGVAHPGLFGALASGMQIAVALLNRFSAKRGSMYSESILSESLAMPLYVLFCVDLWEWMQSGGSGYPGFSKNGPAEKAPAHAQPASRSMPMLLRLFAVMTLLLASRSHMVIAPALFLAISFLCDILLRNRRSLKRFFFCVLTCLLAYVCSVLFDCCFHLAVHGEFMKHTYGNKAFYSTMMYTATPEDGDRIDPVRNADEKKLYLTLLENCREMNLLEEQIPEGSDWIDMAVHFAESYDNIGFNATIPDVEKYLDERIALYNGESATDYSGAGIDFEKMLTPDADGRLTLTEARRALVYDEVISVINAALIKRMPPISPRAYVLQILSGLMNSVARMSRSLQPFVLAIYALYLILLLRMILSGQAEAALAAGIILLGVVINAAAVGLLMFTQSRYMIYHMGAFYTMLLTMLLIEGRRLLRKKEPGETAEA